MRTHEEIISRIESLKANDFFGFDTSDLIFRLPYDLAKPYLSDEATPETWQPSVLDREFIIQEMREYMDFAWDKAMGERGISAGRSVGHFRAWLWLIGDDEMLAFASSERNYPQYGKPILRAISLKYGFAVPYDDVRMDEMTHG